MGFELRASRFIFLSRVIALAADCLWCNVVLFHGRSRDLSAFIGCIIATTYISWLTSGGETLVRALFYLFIGYTQKCKLIRGLAEYAVSSLNFYPAFCWGKIKIKFETFFFLFSCDYTSVLPFHMDGKGLGSACCCRCRCRCYC